MFNEDPMEKMAFEGRLKERTIDISCWKTLSRRGNNKYKRRPESTCSVQGIARSPRDWNRIIMSDGDKS